MQVQPPYSRPDRARNREVLLDLGLEDRGADRLSATTRWPYVIEEVEDADHAARAVGPPFSPANRWLVKMLSAAPGNPRQLVAARNEARITRPRPIL